MHARGQADEQAGKQASRQMSREARSSFLCEEVKIIVFHRGSPLIIPRREGARDIWVLFEDRLDSAQLTFRGRLLRAGETVSKC